MALVLKPKEHIEYWLRSAAHDLESAETLFEHNRYDWCLFLGHLVVEAFFVRDNPNENVPFIHNLAKLAERTKLLLTEEQRTFLLEINNLISKDDIQTTNLNFIVNAHLNSLKITFPKLRSSTIGYCNRCRKKNPKADPISGERNPSRSGLFVRFERKRQRT